LSYESEYSGAEPGAMALESIEVSSLRMEKQRAIGWDEIRAAGLNG
jgi:hypothetical protein